jgi:DNA polymerase-3 subunit epsilon
MDLLSTPLQDVEYLALDTETNGLGGQRCELTEIGAVLIGGGELHERFSSLVATQRPLGAGIQRFTGITQAMVDRAPDPRGPLGELSRRLQGRVLAAHNATFDTRVLRQAFARSGLRWPEPPVLCTVAMARALLPLQRQRSLGALADALGVEVCARHRALADAETCAHVLCALLPRLCVHAGTVAEALELLAPRRRRGGRRGAAAPVGSASLAGSVAPRAGQRSPQAPSFSELPRDPGVYIFRDELGNPLYVGKSVSVRNRARAHFAPSAPPAAWRQRAALVEYVSSHSELGALITECRLIKRLQPPGNTQRKGGDPRLCYIVCRLDIPFPVLEVSAAPAVGHAVSVGPLRGRERAAELVEQLDSIFGLRHCGRRLARRLHPSAYGQMGRCLSPCLGDLDPNLYRRRLDEALGVFAGLTDGRERLLEHLREQMRAAASSQRYERAAALRGRLRRLTSLLSALEGVLAAVHGRPRLLLAPHPTGAGGELLWMAGGRLVDIAPLALLNGRPSLPGVEPQRLGEELLRQATAALDAVAGVGRLGLALSGEQVEEVRIVDAYLVCHPATPTLALAPMPDARRLAEFVTRAFVPA